MGCCDLNKRHDILWIIFNALQNMHLITCLPWPWWEKIHAWIYKMHGNFCGSSKIQSFTSLAITMTTLWNYFRSHVSEIYQRQVHNLSKPPISAYDRIVRSEARMNSKDKSEHEAQILWIAQYKVLRHPCMIACQISRFYHSTIIYIAVKIGINTSARSHCNNRCVQKDIYSA